MTPAGKSRLKAAWSGARGVVLAQVRRGLSPRTAALAVALGAWIGVIPVLGATTLLCLAAGWLLRLNQAVLLAVSLLAYPLQLALLVPFLDLGARAFGQHLAGLAWAGLAGRLKTAPWEVARELGWVEAHACVVWFGLGLAVVPVLWFAFERLFRTMAGAGPVPPNGA